MNAGPNATTYLLPAEVYPTLIRATGHGIAAASGKVGAVVGTFFLPLAVTWFGLSPSIAVIAVLTGVGAIVTWVFRIETRGKGLDANDELGEELRSGQLDDELPPHERHSGTT